ncbi:hypothetical protein H6G64_35410 [Calothrix sp. FACHB-156]|nr:hypothetical protein [Calothrix sp. FACHB-156]
MEFKSNKFKVIEFYQSKTPSIRKIVKELNELIEYYKFAYLFMNKNTQLEKVLKDNSFDPKIKEINIQENIFTTLAMYNDGDLLIDKHIESDIKKALNDFVIDEEYEHHIVQALFLSIEFSLCNIFWYSDIYKNPNAFDFNNLMD